MKQSDTQNQDGKSRLSKALELLQQGDERGFEDVYAETYQYVYQRAKYMMDDEEEALDLVQEVYLSLHRDVKKIKNIESIYGWLKTTTYRQGLKQIEKHRKSGQLVENEVVVFGSITDDAAEIEENYARKKDLDFVHDCILQLSEEQKIVVLAYYYDDMKIEEIASFFGISIGTVKSRLYLARKKLKTMISDEEEKQGYKFYGFCGPLVTATLTSMLEKEIPVDLIQRNNILENLHDLLQSGAVEDVATATGAVISKTIGNLIMSKIAEIGAKKVAITTVSVGLATATAVTGYVAVNNELVHFGGGEQDTVWEQEVSDAETDPVQDEETEPEIEQEPEIKQEPEIEQEEETSFTEDEPVVEDEPYISEALGTLRPQEEASKGFSLSEEKSVDVTLLGSWPAMGAGTIASYGKYSITVLDEAGAVVASQSGEMAEQDVSLQTTLPKGDYTVILSNPGTYENEDSALDYYMMISF